MDREESDGAREAANAKNVARAKIKVANAGTRDDKGEKSDRPPKGCPNPSGPSTVRPATTTPPGSAEPPPKRANSLEMAHKTASLPVTGPKHPPVVHSQKILAATLRPADSVKPLRKEPEERDSTDEKPTTDTSAARITVYAATQGDGASRRVKTGTTGSKDNSDDGDNGGTGSKKVDKDYRDDGDDDVKQEKKRKMKEKERRKKGGRRLKDLLVKMTRTVLQKL